MKSFKLFLENKSYNNEMEDWYLKRTNNHIKLVRKYCKLIEDKFPDEFNGLYQRSARHDANKFTNPLYIPYIHLTWKYKTQSHIIPDNIDITKATEYHVKTNDHHPEFWCDQTNTINPNDRDKPNILIDGTKMPDINLAEMCADWMAVSEEKNSNPNDWANMNINVRWNFNENQIELIYRCLKLF